MRQEKILIVDDEENTRLTLEEALHPLGHEVVLASSGEEALERLEDRRIGLAILDLKMPGVGGLEVLRRIETERPDITVIILTAHGTVDSAVESLKRGALDVIQKPISLDAVRALVRRELDPEARAETRRRKYDDRIDRARSCIGRGDLDPALGHLREAETLDPGRPEAFNLVGVVAEIRRDRAEAQKQYRLALDLDPTYEPARKNQKGSTRGPGDRGPMALGE